MEFLDYDVADLYKEVRAKAEEEGAYDRESWKDIVDAVLADKTEFAEVAEDDVQNMREDLLGRFADFEAEERGEQRSE